MELLILGFLLGLAVAPVLRSWIVWREHRAASREAWLSEQTLKRLEGDRQGSAEHRRDDLAS